MRRITIVTLALAGSAALVGATSLPALAAEGEDTSTVTVTAAVGALEIFAPADAGAVVVVPGATGTIALGETGVTDDRASVLGWSVTASLSDFVSGANSFTATEAAAVYTPAQATDMDNVAVTPTVGADLALGSTVQSGVASGNNSAQWTANLAVTLPANALSGVYVSTLTQSIS